MTDIFKTVLNMSITGAYIAAVIMLLRLPMKKLPKKYSYALWSILGIRLLCPFSVSSAASLFNIIRPETSKNRMSYIPESIEYSAEPKVTVSVPAVNGTINDQLPAAKPENSMNTMQIILYVCTAVWIVGVVIMLIHTAYSYFRVGRVIRDSRCIGENIYVCENIGSPFVYGIIKPKIYLPENVPENDMKYIIAHELTHIKRGDHIIKLIAMLALSLHWFDPLVWVSYKLMVKDMELSCDEKAVQSFEGDVRKDYANALLNMSVKQNRLYGLPAFGESSIKSRIKGVLSLKKPKFIAVITAVILLIAAAVCLLTNAENDRADIAGGRYISEKNIAMAAYSSLLSDDSGYFYDFAGDTLTVTSRVSDISRRFKLSEWTSLPYTAEEWQSMTKMLLGFDMSGYENVRYMELDGEYLLIRADGELWIAELSGFGDDSEIRSIYSLELYDEYADDNYNAALGSFEITKTAEGYEVRSPLTDIYFFFTEDDHDCLHLRRDGTAEEADYSYLGGFDPYKTGLYLSDITGDGTDDIFVCTYITGTGVVDNIAAVIDGQTMEEIAINRLEAERLISESSADLLKDEVFDGYDLYISAIMPEMDEKYIYPYYPDKTVKRYGGMMYEMNGGRIVGKSVFGFVRNEKEYSKLYSAELVFEYHDGELIPVSIDVRTDRSPQIPISNSFTAVSGNGYVYDIPLEDGRTYIMPYIYGDPAEAPIAAEYSENSLRLYPTENADGEYHILRLLRDGDNYYYEISDTNSRSFFSVDDAAWQMLENGIDMYSPRIIRSYVTEELSDGKYLVFGENGNYTIDWEDKLSVGADIIVVYIGNVYAVDNAVLDVIDVIPAETADEENIPDSELCAAYLTEYINAVFGTGEHNAEQYSDNKSFIDYAKLKYEYERAIRAGDTLTELMIHSDNAAGGEKADGTKWLAFGYEISFMYDGSAEESGYGRTAYFEYSEDDNGRLRIISAADFGPCDVRYFGVPETLGEPPFELDFAAAAEALRNDITDR